jgi:hypothetical protein
MRQLATAVWSFPVLSSPASGFFAVPRTGLLNSIGYGFAEWCSVDEADIKEFFD